MQTGQTTKTQAEKAQTGKRGIRIRRLAAVAVVAAVGLTAACSRAEQSKGGSMNTGPLAGEGINNNALPVAPT
jgi:hypothetical protein